MNYLLTLKLIFPKIFVHKETNKLDFFFLLKKIFYYYIELFIILLIISHIKNLFFNMSDQVCDPKLNLMFSDKDEYNILRYLCLIIATIFVYTLVAVFQISRKEYFPIK